MPREERALAVSKCSEDLFSNRLQPYSETRGGMDNAEYPWSGPTDEFIEVLMLETRATVVQTDGQYALVQANQGNGCGQCNGKGCGTGKLSQLFCSQPRQFRVDNPINARVGDEVIVSVADGAVMRGIAQVYLLPLVLLLIGALLGSLSATQPEQRDAYAAMGALGGLVAGFLLSRWLGSRQDHAQNRPFIARRWQGEM